MKPDFTKYNLANTDHREQIRIFLCDHDESAVPDLIQFHMAATLVHYIECTWGACCQAKYEELIQPHLKSAELLDEILRSRVIKDKGNVIIGRTGARIFPELLEKLGKCSSVQVRSYLQREFG